MTETDRPATTVNATKAQGVTVGTDITQINYFGGGRPQIVLVGFTPELAEHPVSRSFVAAARDAITEAGLRFVRMPCHNGASLLTASQCRQSMEQVDLFVSLIGFCYGPLVKDNPFLSYAHLEYDLAAASGRRHIAILINGSDQYDAPDHFYDDTTLGDKQRQQTLRDLVRHRPQGFYEVDHPKHLYELLVILLLDPTPERVPTEPPDQADAPTEEHVTPPPDDATVPEPETRTLVDHHAAVVAVVLGIAGFAVLGFGLDVPAGWAAGIAALAAAGTYVGGLRWPRQTELNT